MFYQPPPSKWGRWRATRAGRGACDGCRFLTIERQYRPWRPYHRCAIPLPRVERSTSSNHTSLTLVFLGRFPIRPVSQSASSYGLASWTGQQRGRLGLRASVPLRGCGFEITPHMVNIFVAGEFPSPCGDVVLKFSLFKRKEDDFYDVSVPLRGCGFEMLLSPLCMVDRIVSVPLRGCGFEIFSLGLNKEENKSFRPLAGMWF